MTKIRVLLEDTEKLVTGLMVNENAELNEDRLRSLIRTTALSIIRITKMSDLLKYESKTNEVIYSDDGAFSFEWFGSGIAIVDLSGKLYDGKVKEITIETRTSSSSSIADYLKQADKDFSSVANFVAEAGRVWNDSISVGVYHEERDYIFNPVEISKVKRLNRMPRKWSADHVVSALINGQYSHLSGSNEARVTDILTEVKLLKTRGKLYKTETTGLSTAELAYTVNGKIRKLTINLALDRY